MRTEHQRSAGGVVTRGEEILLIALKGGRRWQLPKGHIEAGETAQQAAVREVEEETGVRGEPVAELPRIAYWFFEEGRRIHKTVDYFLLDYRAGSCRDFDPQEVSGAAWFLWDDALRHLSFANERRVAEAARQAWESRRQAAAGREER